MNSFHRVISPAAACALALGMVGTAHAQFEPDAETLALYHFDTQTAEGTTPDSGPYGLDGTLAGAVLPTHAPAIAPGFGFAYDFDGVDRGLGNNSRISMGTDGRVGLRGNLNWTLDVLVSVPRTLTDDAYFRGIVCRAGPDGIDFALSYSSWTNPLDGPEHEFWFTTAGANSEGQAPEYTFASSNYTGQMQAGQSYAVRVTVAAGAISITVNGAPGNGPPYPVQPGMMLPPTVPPMPGELTVGDDCPEDYVVKPSELQIDELRISNTAREDLLPGLPPLPLLLPSNRTFQDAQAAQDYRRSRLALAAQTPPPPVVPLRAPARVTRLLR